jgi:hypothetical protein
MRHGQHIFVRWLEVVPIDISRPQRMQIAADCPLPEVTAFEALFVSGCFTTARV